MQGKKWKSFMAKLYGFGAAVVIIGAMFKIQHWPFAGPMLVVGLSVEAVIFFFSAFEKPHEDPDWSLVYPELAGLPGEGGGGGNGSGGGNGLSATQELDLMLEEAKIGPELIENLGNSLRSLGDNVEKLGNVTDATLATESYVSNVKRASDTVGSLSEAYVKASASLGAMVVDSGEGISFGEEMKKLGNNLTDLNQQYALQLQGTKQFLEASGQLYGGMGELMGTLNESVDDAKKYKHEVAQLAHNISSLNTVYGNMLSAMNRPGA